MPRAFDKLTTIAVGVSAAVIATVGVVGAVSLAGRDPGIVEMLRTQGAADSRTPGSVVSPDVATSNVSAAQVNGSGVWALVVGVDDYPGDDFDLRAGVADALEVDAALHDAGVPAMQRRVLLDGDATIGSFRDGLDWLVAHAGPDATAVVFFSGHVREVGGDPDGDGEELDEAAVLGDGGQILDGEVASALRDLRARRAWIGVAACYGGGFDDLLGPGRVLTAASPEGDLAYENDAFGHTYLVEYMVGRALRGGADSVQDAFGDAVRALRADYPNRVPVMFDRAEGPVTLSPTET